VSTQNLKSIFEERTQNISSIFSSYRTLYDIYLSALKTADANQNTIIALEKAKASVDNAQSKISNQLYSQGFILLVGAAEAFLKDIFDSLLTENFTKIKTPAGLNFSANEVQDAVRKWSERDNSLINLNAALGKLVQKRLHDTKNPIEKLNFQNVQTMRTLFDTYFDIYIADSTTTKTIHKYWQQRHSLIHNAGVIDKRYIHNVQAVGLLDKDEQLGAEISISRGIYTKAVKNFSELFDEMDRLIKDKKLNFALIGSTDEIELNIDDLFID